MHIQETYLILVEKHYLWVVYFIVVKALKPKVFISPDGLTPEFALCLEIPSHSRDHHLCTSKKGVLVVLPFQAEGDQHILLSKSLPLINRKNHVQVEEYINMFKRKIMDGS